MSTKDILKIVNYFAILYEFPYEFQVEYESNYDSYVISSFNKNREIDDWDFHAMIKDGVAKIHEDEQKLTIKNVDDIHQYTVRLHFALDIAQAIEIATLSESDSDE